jgi:hypothetical protein
MRRRRSRNSEMRPNTTALLDHLFGIQVRGDCSCTGPYGHRLLGIDQDGSERYRRLIHDGLGGAKPGWVRLSPYYASEEDLESLVSAIEAVADDGDAFVPLYRFSWRHGSWTPLTGASSSPARLEAARALA